MKQDLTHIVLLLDSSGSMASIKDDVEGSIQTFISEQKKVKGDATVTLFEFNGGLAMLRKSQDIRTFEPVRLTPVGGTALYDAMVNSIRMVGAELALKPEEERPGQVLFVIITDGHENSSRKYNADHARTEVLHQTEKYNWKFIFLGANMDAFAVGGSVGTRGVGFAASPGGIQRAVGYASSYAAASRLAVQGSHEAKAAVAQADASVRSVTDSATEDFMAKVAEAVANQSSPKSGS